MVQAKPTKAKPEPKTPFTEVEKQVAEYINSYICYVPGCAAYLHLDDARNILVLIKKAES